MGYDDELRRATDAEDTRIERSGRCGDCGHDPCKCDDYHD